MPKVEQSQDYERQIPPRAKYRATLTSVLSRTMTTRYGTKPKFMFFFTLNQVMTRVDGETVWKPVPMPKEGNLPYRGITTTGTKYGNSEADLTKLVKQLIGEHADEWNEKSGDTDALLGWKGEIVIDHTQTQTANGPRNYAVITQYVTDPRWLEAWADNMEGDENLILAQTSVPAGMNNQASYTSDNFDPFSDEHDPFAE